ncbi:MAG: SirB2 family protein [Porticoccus sp.]|nr:SirB2 family protein [Porticoccus sp.]MBQ0806357.1 SirB2 family protein [Porticoccus sp.]
MYLLIKQAHISFAIISISFFVLRAFWSVTESAKLQQRWAKIAPHIIDTLLLGSAIYLMMTTEQYPFADHWLTAKFIALLVYIVTGTIAIKRGKTAGVRLLFSLLAIATFAYIVAVAVTQTPWFL